ncbi:MAG: hypothetical protein KDA65_15770 [Planctomycetaceae bacterium]|nr:hypothetical protein [Planctomycetaceae bacterium]
MDKRREAEAAEAQGTKKKAKKKKATRKKSTRKSAKAVVRRRLVWGVFSGSLKEEARFPYDQRDAAEEKLEQLRNRSAKKMYFIQPIKEPVGDGAPVAPVSESAPEEDEDIRDEAVDTDDDDIDTDEDADGGDEDLDLEDIDDLGDDLEMDDDDDSADEGDDED